MADYFHRHPWITVGIHTRGSMKKVVELSGAERRHDGTETADVRERLINNGKWWSALEKRHFMSIHWVDGSITRINSRGVTHVSQSLNEDAELFTDESDASSLDIEKLGQWTVLAEREADNSVHTWQEYLCFAEPGVLAVCHNQVLDELPEDEKSPAEIDGIPVVAVMNGFALGPMVPREDEIVVLESHAHEQFSKAINALGWKPDDDLLDSITRLRNGGLPN